MDAGDWVGVALVGVFFVIPVGALLVAVFSEFIRDLWKG